MKWDLHAILTYISYIVPHNEVTMLRQYSENLILTTVYGWLFSAAAYSRTRRRLAYSRNVHVWRHLTNAATERCNASLAISEKSNSKDVNTREFAALIRLLQQFALHFPLCKLFCRARPLGERMVASREFLRQNARLSCLFALRISKKKKK